MTGLGLGCAGAMIGRLAGAAETESLYQAQAIVTGQFEPERSRGLALCLEDVLIKLSGDPTLARDPRLAPLEAQARGLVAAYSYHDRMEGIPIHDEQGTRDRPYDLLVSFEPAKIDAALRALGRTAWTAPRPRLALFIVMRNGGSRLLTSDGERDFVERFALAEAASRRGVPIVLPSTSVLAAAGITEADLAGGEPARLAEAAIRAGGDRALIGRLDWEDANLAWTARWNLPGPAGGMSWQIHVGSFDAAFRSGLEGAAQSLSGSGVPGEAGSPAAP